MYARSRNGIIALAFALGLTAACFCSLKFVVGIVALIIIILSLYIIRCC